MAESCIETPGIVGSDRVVLRVEEGGADSPVSCSGVFEHTADREVDVTGFTHHEVQLTLEEVVEAVGIVSHALFFEILAAHIFTVGIVGAEVGGAVANRVFHQIVDGFIGSAPGTALCRVAILVVRDIAGEV